MVLVTVVVLMTDVLQGILEGCAKREAGAGPLATGAPTGHPGSATLPIPAPPHGRQLACLCHNQARRLCQALCRVSLPVRQLSRPLACKPGATLSYLPMKLVFRYLFVHHIFCCEQAWEAVMSGVIFVEKAPNISVFTVPPKWYFLSKKYCNQQMSAQQMHSAKNQGSKLSQPSAQQTTKCLPKYGNETFSSCITFFTVLQAKLGCSGIQRAQWESYQVAMQGYTGPDEVDIPR